MRLCNFTDRKSDKCQQTKTNSKAVDKNFFRLQTEIDSRYLIVVMISIELNGAIRTARKWDTKLIM